MYGMSCRWDEFHQPLVVRALLAQTDACANPESKVRPSGRTAWGRVVSPVWGRRVLGVLEGATDDPELVRAVQRGDRSAISRVLDGCLPPLRRYLANHYGLSTDDLEDVLQEVRVAFLDAATRFRGRCRLKTYLTQIACRKCVDHLRTRSRQAGESYARDERRLEAHSTDPEDSVPTRVALQAALAELSPRQRQVVVMYHCEGRSYTEIAHDLDIAIGTVAATKAEALQRLRSLLTSASAGPADISS